MVQIKANLHQVRRSVRRHLIASPTGQISVKLYGGKRCENISVKSEFADNRTQIWDSLYIELSSFHC